MRKNLVDFEAMRIHLIILIAVALLPFQTIAQDTVTAKYTHFAALKNGERKLYPIGTRLLIKYSKDSIPNKVRGIVAGVSETEIFIKKRKKEDELIRVEFNDITLVRKINPSQKIVYGIVGTTLVVGGVAFIESGSNSPASAMRGALVIPVIGVGAYFLYAVPITLLIEKINERRSSNGWTFQSL